MRPVHIDETKMIDLYVNQKLTIRACASILNVGEASVRRRLKKMEIKIRPSIKNKIEHIDEQKVVDLYWNQKLSIEQTSKALGTSMNFVRGRLEKSGHGVRSVSEGSRLWRCSDDILDDELIYLYDLCGWSCEKISAHFNKSPQFTRHRFIAIGKKRRKNIGKNNGSWKGGITDIRNSVRSCAASLKWRNDAFARQGYKSQISGEQIRELNCHHIYPFHVILRSSLTKHTPLPDEYRSLAIIGDPRFYDEDNSLVMSKDEHDKIEKGKLEQAHPWWKIWRVYPDFAINNSNLATEDFNLFKETGQIHPSSYNIQVVQRKDVKSIIRYEHYLGNIPRCKLMLVARQRNIIVGIATFGTGTNKYIKPDTWELTRLCVPFYVLQPFSCDFLSECCQYIRHNHPYVKNLISFADSSVGHNGGVYRMAQWSKAGKTALSYAYFDPVELKLMHKASCRRIKGVDKTERELAQERGWIRIPLSHKHRYVLSLQ